MRPPPQRNNWRDSLPAEERQKLLLAWQEYRCCRDCACWDPDKDLTVATCDLVTNVAFIVPEDYTCDDFKNRDSS